MPLEPCATMELRATGLEPAWGLPWGSQPAKTPAGPKPAVYTDFTTPAWARDRAHALRAT